MEDESKDLKGTSRRNFTKAAAAALIAVPFMPTALSAQRKVKSTKRRSLHLPIPRGASGFSTRPDTGIEEHIPPMTLTDGSMEINSYFRCTPETGQASSGRWLYKIPAFEGIKKVTIMVTNELDFTTPFWCLFGPPVCNPREAVLKIWLQIKAEGGNRYEPYPINMASTIPQLIIRDAGSGELQMDLDKELLRSDTDHPYRSHKFQHPGYARHFRIGGIEVSGLGCPTYRWFTRDFDHYRIQIFGKDIDPD